MSLKTAREPASTASVAFLTRVRSCGFVRGRESHTPSLGLPRMNHSRKPSAYLSATALRMEGPPDGTVSLLVLTFTLPKSYMSSRI
jgi:hypothetical protein